MFLYLIQHAEAKKEEEDPQRGLTEKGVQDIGKVASFAGKMNIKATQIYHSGKIRAFQTAAVLSDYLKPAKGVSETNGLSPMEEPEIWSDRISEMNEDTILVGHLPHLGRLASLILCGNRDKNIIDFKMGGIVCLKRFEDGRWSLEWMIIPEVLP